MFLATVILGGEERREPCDKGDARNSFPALSAVQWPVSAPLPPLSFRKQRKPKINKENNNPHIDKTRGNAIILL